MKILLISWSKRKSLSVISQGNFKHYSFSSTKMIKGTQPVDKKGEVFAVFFKKLFISFIIYLAELSLCCCVQAFSTCSEWGLLSVGLWGLLLAVSVFSCCRAQVLGFWALLVVEHGLSCSAACGIFLDQGLNLCPLHWQVDSYPLFHQGSPAVFLIFTFYMLNISIPMKSLVKMSILKQDIQFNLTEKVYTVLRPF